MHVSIGGKPFEVLFLGLKKKKKITVRPPWRGERTLTANTLQSSKGVWQLQTVDPIVKGEKEENLH